MKETLKILLMTSIITGLLFWLLVHECKLHEIKVNEQPGNSWYFLDDPVSELF